MTPERRALAYFRQKPGAMTPAQRRRYRAKVLRGLQSEGVLFSRLPAPLHAPADGVGTLPSLQPAPAPAPTALSAAGVGVTPDSVASAFTYATDGAPQTTQDAAHAPTVAVTSPVTVGASGGAS